MRVAVTGAGGRLGRALIAALEDAPFTGPAGRSPGPGPTSTSTLTRAVGAPARPRPPRARRSTPPPGPTSTAAPATPSSPMRRNGEADRRARRGAAPRAGSTSSLVSTNEVFDGARTDGRGYAPRTDRPGQRLRRLQAGRRASCARPTSGRRPRSSPTAAAGPASPQLAIVRTVLAVRPAGQRLPGQDRWPRRSAPGRRRAAPGRRRRDRLARPTPPISPRPIVELLWAGRFGGRSTTSSTAAPRPAPDWAREVLRLARVDIAIDEVPAATWTRASTPPRWAVLEPTPTPSGEPLRSWQAALAERMALRH